jgi:hypothetical protein
MFRNFHGIGATTPHPLRNTNGQVVPQCVYLTLPENDGGVVHPPFVRVSLFSWLSFQHVEDLLGLDALFAKTSAIKRPNRIVKIVVWKKRLHGDPGLGQWIVHSVKLKRLGSCGELFAKYLFRESLIH